MKSIPLSGPDISEQEIDAVLRVMRSGRLSLGSEVPAFEEECRSYMGSKFAIALSSGTAGLHCIMKALDIKDGDEVITSPFSFIASANSILFERASPLFVDIDPETLCLDPEKIEEKITPRTKAVLAVHVFGMPCEMDRLSALTKKVGLYLIEDACEAFGGTWKNKKLGTFGKAGVYAFYPNKQMTTGEGGMIVTDDGELADEFRSLRNQGRSLDDNNAFVRLGYNYRLTDFQAAIGRVQLARIDEILAKRRQVASWYEAELEKCLWIKLPPQTENAEEMSWFVYVIRLAEPFRQADRDQLRQHLHSQGIQTGCYFPAIHLSKFYRDKFNFKRGDFPRTEEVSDRSLALPFHNGMSRGDVAMVCEKVISFMERLEAPSAKALR